MSLFRMDPVFMILYACVREKETDKWTDRRADRQTGGRRRRSDVGGSSCGGDGGVRVCSEGLGTAFVKVKFGSGRGGGGKDR